VTTLRLALSAGAQKRLSAALERDRPARATVAARAVDHAGNASTAKRTIVLSG
jgi:hypothetical protein